MSSISPNVTHLALPYHEVSAARLPALTYAGLQAAGLPLEALGLRMGQRAFLTSCFTLSSYAQEILPPSLGGENIDAESRLSRLLSDFSQRPRLPLRHWRGVSPL